LTGRHVPVRWGGATRGWLDTGRALYYRLARSEHWCVRHGGWGFQAEILERLRALGCRTVELRFENGRVIRAALARVLEEGVRDVLRPEDGEQVFLPDSAFEEVRPRDSARLSPPAPSTEV